MSWGDLRGSPKVLVLQCTETMGQGSLGHRSLLLWGVSSLVLDWRFWAWKSLSRRWDKRAPAASLASGSLLRPTHGCPCHVDAKSVLLLGYLLSVCPSFQLSVFSLPYFHSENSNHFCMMAAMGRLCTVYGPPSPRIQAELSDSLPGVSLFHIGCHSCQQPQPRASTQSLPGHWECQAEHIPFPSAASVPAAIPGSAQPWLSRACSDVQKFLLPNHGWMWGLCDCLGLPSHAELLRLPLGAGLLLLFDKPPCWVR